MADKLKAIYNGSFKGRKRFDDGGSSYGDYISYASPGPSAQYYGTGDSGPIASDTPPIIENVTPGDVNSTLGNAGTLFGDTPVEGSNQTLGQLANAAGSGSGGSGAGSLGKLLGLSSGSTGLTALEALAGLGGLAASYSNNKANTPAFNPPALFGGTPGTTSGNTAGSASTGYGPAGGYNHANYAGLTPASSQAGLGYTPRTQTNYGSKIPNYYTYGQGPQQSFFTHTQPTGTQPVGGAPLPSPMPPVGLPGNMQMPPPTSAPMTGVGQIPKGPVARANGGLMKKYAVGGPAQMPRPMQPPAFTQGPVNTPPPVFNQPAAPPVQQARPPMSMPIGPAGGQPTMARPPMPAPQPMGPAGGQPSPMPMRPQLPVARPPMNTGVQRPPMMGMRPMMRAAGGSTQQPAKTGLAAMFPQRTWAGPVAQDPYSNMAGHASGGSQGGESPLSTVSRHVVGPGDGTSDDIPARLANGEYVMDAQTVSMVGNGSNDAGAKKLDEFRANVRKHKGKALAKGEMAPDVHKNLHKYLGGGS